MLLAVSLFLFGYLMSMSYTSIFYHRALAHEALILPTWMKKFIQHTGMLVTGIDPKGWICMHRLHHLHSDSPQDPHSPHHTGFWYTFIKQHKSFETTIIKLIKRDPKYTVVVEDIPFDVHYLNKAGFWYVPFVAHALIGFAIAIYFQNPLAGCGYFFGICGHPIQGFMVNAFGHSLGYKTFDCGDQSTNNTFVALTCMGEGYQNNHHQFPGSPKFSMKASEFDPGYVVIKCLSAVGMVKINHHQIPRISERVEPALSKLRPLVLKKSNILLALVLGFALYQQIPLLIKNSRQSGKHIASQKLPSLNTGEFIEFPPAQGSCLAIFWASWCAPCKLEMARLKSSVDSGKIPKTAIFAINPFESDLEVKKFLAENSYPFTFVISTLSKELDITATPTTLFFENGIITSMGSGMSLWGIWKAEWKL